MVQTVKHPIFKIHLSPTSLFFLLGGHIFGTLLSPMAKTTISTFAACLSPTWFCIPVKCRQAPQGRSTSPVSVTHIHTHTHTPVLRTQTHTEGAVFQVRGCQAADIFTLLSLKSQLFKSDERTRDSFSLLRDEQTSFLTHLKIPLSTQCKCFKVRGNQLQCCLDEET